ARVLSTRIEDVSGWEIAGLNAQPEMRSNAWIRWRARAYGGEHGTPPASWDEFGLLRSSESLRAMGIVYISAPPGVPQDSAEFREVARDAHEVVYRLRDALGRVYAVPRVRRLPADSAIVAAMNADGFHADRVAYALDAAAAGEYPGSSSAHIAWSRDEPDELVLGVDAAAPAFVVIADA